MSEEQLTKNVEGEKGVVNIIEDMVRLKVNDMIKDFDMCDCDLCRLNACAIALNNLPPHYVTTKKGALLGKVDDIELTYRARIAVEVAKALKIVKERPLH